MALSAVRAAASRAPRRASAPDTDPGGGPAGPGAKVTAMRGLAYQGTVDRPPAHRGRSALGPVGRPPGATSRTRRAGRGFTSLGKPRPGPPLADRPRGPTPAPAPRSAATAAWSPATRGRPVAPGTVTGGPGSM
jgi:hypothetical protein